MPPSYFYLGQINFFVLKKKDKLKRKKEIRDFMKNEGNETWVNNILKDKMKFDHHKK